MPESVRDRPTKAHEYIFLLAKSQRYYYDQDAIREPAINGERFHGGYDKPGVIKRTVARNGRVSLNNRTLYRNKRTVWTVPTRPFKGAHFACVDESTQCLTRRGWKDYRELIVGEEIAAFDIESGLLMWVPLLDVYTYCVKQQEMITVESRDLSMLLTPNHRCVVRKRTKKATISNDYRIVRAEQLNSRHYIPTAAPWMREEYGANVDPCMAELFGWYVTEGWQQGKRVRLEQSLSHNADNVERIRWLLNTLGAEYKMRTRKRSWRGRPANSVEFTIYGYVASTLSSWASHKCLPWDVLWWAEDSLKGLLRGIVGGDGHIREDGRISIVQKSKEFIDMVQAIAVRLGYTAVVRQRKDNGIWTCYLTKRSYRGLRNTNGKGIKIERKNYSGIIWCPHTSLGTFVARRRGTVFITGNTFPPDLIRPCILAGCPPGGIVLDPFFGAGTVGVVALEEGRHFIGIELNPEYCEMARERIEGVRGMQRVQEIPLL